MKPRPIIDLRLWLTVGALVLFAILGMRWDRRILQSCQHITDDDAFYSENSYNAVLRRGFDVSVADLKQSNHASSSSVSQRSQQARINNTNVCQVFRPEQSLPALWQQMHDTILASTHITDDAYYNASLVRVVFDSLAPSRLARGLITRPHYDLLQPVLDILSQRYHDPNQHPPLQIAVFGGSVTVGSNCRGTKDLQGKPCAWPAQLEKVINGMAGMQLVQVHNLGFGGTSTGQGQLFVEYGMFPPALVAAGGPDVIINAYSTNDSLPPWHDHELVDYKTYRNARDRLQDFIRVVLLSRPCDQKRRPLMVNLDDYLGLQHDAILGEQAYWLALTQITDWYQTAAISYAHVVRDVVYQNPFETWFSASFLKKKNDIVQPIREVHFVYTGHLAIAWTLAYNALSILRDYCEHDFVQWPVRPYQLPPVLNNDTMLSNVAKLRDPVPPEWKEHRPICSSGNATTTTTPCVETWMAAPSAFFQPHQLQAYMRQRVVSNKGWSAAADMSTGWARKVGWVATQANAAFDFVRRTIPQPVQAITFMYMRSYGDKWKDSLVNVQVFVTDKGDAITKDAIPQATLELEGTHGSPTSITYNHKVTLQPPAPAGSTITIRVKLVGGTTFKILGMMLCSW